METKSASERAEEALRAALSDLYTSPTYQPADTTSINPTTSTSALLYPQLATAVPEAMPPVYNASTITYASSALPEFKDDKTEKNTDSLWGPNVEEDEEEAEERKYGSDTVSFPKW